VLAANKWPFRRTPLMTKASTAFSMYIEEVNRDVPFKGLNWFFDHCETISTETLNE